MVNILRLFFFVIPICFLCSCGCKTATCPTGRLTLEMVGYNHEDIDTLEIIKFEPGSILPLTDSTLEFTESQYWSREDTAFLTIEQNIIKSDHNWIIRIPSTNQQLLLENLSYDNQTYTYGGVTCLGLGALDAQVTCYNPLLSASIDGSPKKFDDSDFSLGTIIYTFTK